MDKTKTIFFKIGSLMALIILIFDLLVLWLSYNITYDQNLKIYEEELRNVAQIGAQYSESLNLLDDSVNPRTTGAIFDNLCKTFDVTYTYVVKPDIKKRNETYLAIGFGEDASEEAKVARFRGVVVEGSLNDAEIKAYNGDTSGVIHHEKNQFGETLISYVPCTRYMNIKSGEYKKYDEPLIFGAEISLNLIVKNVQRKFMRIALLTVSLTLLIAVAFALILYFKVSRPINKISGKMMSFVTDRENDVSAEKLEVKGSDEFALMSRAFNTMTDEIESYINDIDALNREKHMTEAELNIARNIQMGLLQPDRMDCSTASISAYMLPAKDVGGDLYDYRVLNDGRIFVTVADVSGKGISAALFMSRAVTLLQLYAAAGFTPAEILAKYNNKLAENNPSGLFITTFLAIYDPALGVLTYSNAGHNFPYILSDSLKTLSEAHGIAAGLFAGEEYENAEIQLNEGDTLFLYTDGVNEAKDAEGRFYTTERLEQEFASADDKKDSAILKRVLGSLNSFTEDAQQNDDITILTMTAKAHDPQTVLHLQAVPENLIEIQKVIHDLDVSPEMKRTLRLAAEEIFINICSYAYKGSGEVELRIAVKDRVEMIFADSGAPFDPTREVVDIEEYDHDNAIGGLGRFLVFSIADEYRYEYTDDQNILRLYFKEEGIKNDGK